MILNNTAIKTLMKQRIFLAMLVLAAQIAMTVQAGENALPATASPTNLSVATFAGGCFWCTEADFEKLPGVQKVISGFSGGHVANPTYEQVSSGKTGHVESVQVYYDRNVISYEKLLTAFWKMINPTDNEGQFVDRGNQYRPIIFYRTEQEKALAEQSKRELNETKRYPAPVVTEIKKFEVFYPAEDYHQDYYKNNTLRYKYYRYRSGRDQYLKKIWGDDMATKTETNHAKPAYSKPDDATLLKTLTPLQYDVTQKEATEPPFKNAYWNEKHDGIYVDIVSGEPLFSSHDKFDSGTGWPSFSKPLVADNILQKKDFLLIFPRTEIHSRYGSSHLGHVFNDGPKPTGLRYCINSASLRFIPVEDMEKEGYGDFLADFNR